MTGQLTAASMCSGYGGLDMAVAAVLDTRLLWVADNDDAAARVLAHRFPRVPNLGDLTGIDWGTVPAPDVLTAGFPCQDLSYAGRGAGIKEGTRSGLWHTIATAVATLRPRLLVLENVRAIVTRRPGLDVVLADLASLGFDANWTCLPACDVGAAHERWRWFCLAWPAADATCVGTGEPADQAHPFPACGQARALPGSGGVRAAAHAHREFLWQQSERQPRRNGASLPEPSGLQRSSAADADDAQWSGQQGEQPRRPAPAGGGGSDIDWGPYAPAVVRWEATCGRAAPWPVEPGRRGKPRLSPRFSEWLMGLPAGWVTDVPGISRNGQLRLLGNGVLPRQGAVAVADLLPDHLMPFTLGSREEIAA
ncbi:DNA cytosine methyltransferase [Nonomuraea angiospora]|uniref:DNA cytosine methyltransferase n=1 Tax=Nonomuraea angiospora TaxID=46172 RepID=UPI0033CFFE19